MMIDGIIGTSRTGEPSGMLPQNVEIEYEDDEQLEVSFDTAWAPPEPICYRLREMFKDLSFLGSMMNQNGDSRVSIGHFANCPLGVA